MGCSPTWSRWAQGLSGRLKERFGQHPFVGDIRGRGLFWALELVSDRASKRPFDPAAKLHARVKREAMALGLMVYPMGGTVDGVNGDHVLLAPPFIVEGEPGRRDRRSPRPGARCRARRCPIAPEGRERAIQRAQCLRKGEAFPISGAPTADSAPQSTSRKDLTSWRDASDGRRLCFCPPLSPPPPLRSRRRLI